jgi:MFS family permease
MASAATATTPLWKLEVEREAKSGYYVVIPDSFERLRDPFVAPHLRKWLVLNSVLLHLQMGATPVLLYPLGLDFRTNAAVLGLYGGSFYVAMSVGGAFAGYMFRRFRIAQTLALCVSGAAASSMFTATLPTSSGKSVMALVLLRIMFGLCQAIIMAHSLLWARRTAPRDRTKAWLTVFQFAIPVGILLGYCVAAAVSVGFELKVDASVPPAHWRLVFVIQSLVLVPFAWLFWNLPDEQLAVFPWAASSSNFTPEAPSAHTGYGTTEFHDSHGSYREVADNDAVSTMESSMDPNLPTDSNTTSNSVEFPPPAPAAKDSAPKDAASMLSAGAEVCYVDNLGAQVHGVILESTGQKIRVAPSVTQSIKQEKAESAPSVPPIPQTTDRTWTAVPGSSTTVAAPAEKDVPVSDESAMAEEAKKDVAAAIDEHEDGVDGVATQDDDLSRAPSNDLSATESQDEAHANRKLSPVDALATQTKSTSPESSEETPQVSAPADLPSSIAAPVASTATGEIPTALSSQENLQEENLLMVEKEKSLITDGSEGAPIVDPASEDAPSHSTTTSVPTSVATESALDDGALIPHPEDASLSGTEGPSDPTTALEAPETAAASPDEISPTATGPVNEPPSLKEPCWVDVANIIQIISPALTENDEAESAISPTVGASGSNAGLTFFSPITAGAQLPDVTAADTSPPSSYLTNPSNAPRVSPAEALAAAALSQRRPRRTAWNEKEPSSSNQGGGMAAAASAPSGPELRLEFSSGSEPRTDADVAAAAAAVAVRAAAASTVAAGAAAGASMMAHFRGIVALQAALLRIPNYAPLLGALCAVYFVATGLQFYSTSYLLIGLGLPPLTAYLYVVLVLSTAPTMGVATGSFFVQALEWLGGFRGRQRLASLRRCGYLAVLVAAASSLSLLYPHLAVGQEVARLWATAFLCAALLPTLSELLATAVPRELKTESGTSVRTRAHSFKQHFENLTLLIFQMGVCNYFSYLHYKQ